MFSENESVSHSVTVMSVAAAAADAAPALSKYESDSLSGVLLDGNMGSDGSTLCLLSVENGSSVLGNGDGVSAGSGLLFVSGLLMSFPGTLGGSVGSSVFLAPGVVDFLGVVSLFSHFLVVGLSFMHFSLAFCLVFLGHFPVVVHGVSDVMCMDVVVVSNRGGVDGGLVSSGGMF